MNGVRPKRVSSGPKAGLALACGLAISIMGCTNAQLVDVWRDPGYDGPPLRHVLVASQRQDATARRLWEDSMRDALERNGVQAEVSYDAYPDGPATQKQLRRQVGQNDIDGVLIEKPLAATAETHWVPGWSSIEPREYYNPWAGRDVIVYRNRFHHGYRVLDRTVREQLSVWTGQDDPRMVWAGTVEIENPGSSEDVRKDLAKGLVPGLEKAGLVRARRR